MKIREYAIVTMVTAMVVLFSFSVVYAANTGKISGQVTDKETGEPLIGANVIVLETDLGAATDVSGRFNILQVPPGQYSLQVNYIGYRQVTIREVRVRPDLTTQVDINLPSEALQSEAVEIIAERKMVQQDITSTRRSITQEQITETPGIEDVSDIFRTQAGMVLDDTPEILEVGQGYQLEVRDPSLKSLNIRGSGGGDALILIDGVPASHPMYGGFDVMDLNVEDIQNVEIITGAFSAEYGNTQSAIINITTKSGGKKMRGSINYRNDVLGILGPSYGKHRVAASLSGPEPLTTGKLKSIGIDLPGEMSYFISSTLDITDTPYNNGRDRGPLFVLPFTTDSDGDEVMLLEENQSNKTNINIKLDYKLSPSFNTVLSYRNSWSSWTQFDWGWKYYPGNTSQYQRANQQYQFRINHSLSQKTFYNLTLGYTSVDYERNYYNKTPPDFWVITEDTTYSSIEPPTRNPLTRFYTDRGVEDAWINNYNQQYTFKLDFTSQALPSHLIKMGVEADYKELTNVNIFGGGYGFSEYGRFIYMSGEEYPAPPGPYKEFGTTRWVVNGYPNSGGAYITDKFERESLIINAGVRMDWFMPGAPTNKKSWIEQWKRATELKADWPTVHYQIDPRLGVSFPISTETVLFFSYGHFNKLAGIDNYIRDPYSGGFTGNPHLDFIKSVIYEFGFTHEFPGKWALDIKNYTRETAGQIGTTNLQVEYGLPVYLHDNKGYSRARGLEFEVRKQGDRYFNGNVTYTLQWASGYSSSAFADYRRSLNNLPNPIRERRLDWDVRHQVIFNGSFRVGKNQHPSLFGLRLPPNWSGSVLTTFSSGRPYTPGTYDPVLARKLHNTKTKPPTFRTDIRIEKGFALGGFNASVGLDIDNIFNNYNVTSYGFNTWTGEPYKYGDTIQDSDKLYEYFDMNYLLRPDRFGEGRHTQLILEISW